MNLEQKVALAALVDENSLHRFTAVELVLRALNRSLDDYQSLGAVPILPEEYKAMCMCVEHCRRIVNLYGDQVPRP